MRTSEQKGIQGKNKKERRGREIDGRGDKSEAKKRRKKTKEKNRK